MRRIIAMANTSIAGYMEGPNGEGDLGRLIERGHVAEQPHPRDGRSTLLVLTPTGQEIFDRGLPAFRKALLALNESLGGTLQEHEEAVRRIRIAFQELSAND